MAPQSAVYHLYLHNNTHIKVNKYPLGLTHVYFYFRHFAALVSLSLASIPHILLKIRFSFKFNQKRLCRDFCPVTSDTHTNAYSGQAVSIRINQFNVDRIKFLTHFSFGFQTVTNTTTLAEQRGQSLIFAEEAYRRSTIHTIATDSIHAAPFIRPNVVRRVTHLWCGC